MSPHMCPHMRGDVLSLLSLLVIVWDDVAVSADVTPEPDNKPSLNLDDEMLLRTVKHLNRHTAAGRASAAKDDIVKMYIQAGLRLILQEFEPLEYGEDENTLSPFWAWISRNKVAKETENESKSSGLPRRGNVHGIRDRWDPHKNYIADLLAVALNFDHWSVSASVSPEILEELFTGANLYSLVNQIAYLNLYSTTAANSTFRIHLIAAAMAKRDALVMQALAEYYQSVHSQWSKVYETLLEANGWQLRGGITLDELTTLLTATGEGLTMRSFVDPGRVKLDPDTFTSSMGSIAVAMLIACVDFTGDGMSMEALLKKMMTKGE